MEFAHFPVTFHPPAGMPPDATIAASSARRRSSARSTDCRHAPTERLRSHHASQNLSAPAHRCRNRRAGRRRPRGRGVLERRDVAEFEEGRHGRTLVVENNPQPNFTDTFNPFAATSTGKSQNALALFYEPLMQFNNTKAGTTYPWLAKSFAWSPDGKSITFALRDDVKWSDGQKFTADDVAYTFQLMQQNKALNYIGVPITGVDDERCRQRHDLVLRAANSPTSTASPDRPGSCRSTSGAHRATRPRGPTRRRSAPAPTSWTSSPRRASRSRRTTSYWGGVPAVSKVSFPAYSVERRRVDRADPGRDRLRRQQRQQHPAELRRQGSGAQPLLLPGHQHRRARAERHQVAVQPAGRTPGGQCRREPAAAVHPGRDRLRTAGDVLVRPAAAELRGERAVDHAERPEARPRRRQGQLRS